jgi:hypothetical protein
MNMNTKEYSRLQLAENQLETAIGLFVIGGDKFSVITLAGAADVILCSIVAGTGQSNFTERSRNRAVDNGEENCSKEAHGRDINNTLFINDLKHMDHGEDGFITLDVMECAVAAILKAVANYVLLKGRDRDFIQAFMAWVQLNLDPQKYNINGDPNWEEST